MSRKNYKTFMINTKYCDNETEISKGIYSRVFQNMLYDIEGIEIESYQITNAFGSLNSRNKNILIKDVNGDGTLFAFGNEGDWVPLSTWDSNGKKSFELVNGDTIELEYLTDDKTIRIKNITNTNNFSFDFTGNTPLASFLGYRPKLYSGSNEYFGENYPQNQTLYFNINADIVKEIDDTGYGGIEGVKSMKNIMNDGVYGNILRREFISDEQGLFREVSRPSFQKINFTLTDEFNLPLKIRGHFIINFKLYFGKGQNPDYAY